MVEPKEIQEQVKALLNGPVYGGDEALRLETLRHRMAEAARLHAGYANYISHWPIPLAEAGSIADLPYLPVALFKEMNLSLVAEEQVKMSLHSSSTTGQTPATVPIDGKTGRAMSRGVTNILSHFIGSHRRPYLVMDDLSANTGDQSLGARGAAIRGLIPYASDVVYGLKIDQQNQFELLAEELRQFAQSHGDGPVLIYGFTWILWQAVVLAMEAQGLQLKLPEATVIHSGGWKKLTALAVDKAEYNQRVAKVFGMQPERVIDLYGMVENVGIVYPDCSEGLKHAPMFGGVVIRDTTTLQPVETGQSGLIQVMSVLPGSFPGHSLLTDDLGQLVHAEGCACGRPGAAFRLMGRAPTVEVRGCSDVMALKGVGG
uniref:Acyl-protein synthetase LuxE domain-containing protein n=1 Tax=Magnetococcus massalia (strain MO-1) TaxID=451514 RepID=A0A1S7LCB1_MAGMO|nr:Protein of unknown function. putative containing long-chain-fatty-acid-luciferin-component ligase activity. putative acyl-protein synthetase, LuxE [Candidatus Magnetococcus massalia]